MNAKQIAILNTLAERKYKNNAPMTYGEIVEWNAVAREVAQLKSEFETFSTYKGIPERLEAEYLRIFADVYISRKKGA